ncbi:MAG: T9SS type A sorting domain-containing protein [Ignavibacteriae bacterium]|nr:T9SS type A sorting domain-containing protein [Ignavibacteriota bacterium]
MRLPSGVKPDEVSLRIYNILGQLVRTFDTAGLDMAAPTRVTWDARNDHGAAQSSGTYLLVLQSPKGNMVKRLLLVK